MAEMVVIFMSIMLRYRCFCCLPVPLEYEHGNIEEGK